MAPGRLTAILCAALLALAGCAPAEIKPEAQPHLVWPDVPNPPRIEYVRAFARPDDFGIVKGFFQRLAEVFLGAADQRLVRPMAVLAVNGHVYVADPGASGVHRFDPDAESYELIRAGEEASLPSPVGLASGSEGEIYVTDSDLAQVLVIRPGSKLAEALPLPGLGQPTGIAFDSQRRRLFVADTSAHRVNIYRPDATLEASIGQRGEGEGEFNFPTMLWRDARGWLYVTDSLNFRIQVFDEQGRFVRKFGQAGDGAGDNVRPKSVATDSFGHVYVVDGLHHAVQIFDASGRYLLSVGSMGGGPGEFWLPTGIFIGANDTLYIADSYNQRIQVLRYIGGPT